MVLLRIPMPVMSAGTSLLHIFPDACWEVNTTMQTLAMMMKMMLMMMVVVSSHPALADQSLRCYNDYHDTFKCVWNTSKLDVIPPVRPETKCKIHTVYSENKELSADPTQPHIRSATVVFSSKRGMIIPGATLGHEVHCENYKNPVDTIPEHVVENSVVKVPPPQGVQVHGSNISWSIVSSEIYESQEYQLQYRSAAQSWKDVEGSIKNTQQKYMVLPEERLVLHQEYVVRLRTKKEDLLNAEWSDWSEEYNWTSAVGQKPPSSGNTDSTEILSLESSVAGITLTGVTLSIILICTILIKSKRIKRIVASSPFRVQKNSSTYIPDPSKFFGDLNSSQGGNFTIPRADPDPTHKSRTSFPRWLIGLIFTIIILVLAGSSSLLWYFLEYKVWVLEPRLVQQYTASVSILNKNFSVEKLLSPQTCPDTSTPCGVLRLERQCGGSISWLRQSFLAVTRRRYEVFICCCRLLSFTETNPKVIDLFEAHFDCYRYTSLVSAEPVVLEGPDTQRSSCLWHLRAPAGSRLELRVEWLLTECRDRLIIYDSVTPTDSRLITSLYGCSRYEQTVQLLSSADWMTVVWKQGLYNYKDPFSLSARAWPDQDCSYSIVLEQTDDVQGILRTPFYPSYYPPDTNCSWIFTVPSVEFGLTLFFEGYELNRASYSQMCTQGRWSIQNRRLCGVRGLQPFAERIYLLSSTVTVSMTSEVSLTGPGLQVHYSIFNQSDPCPGQVLCNINGLCVPACDGIADCPNGLDERNCVCIAQFQCSEDSQCVDYYKVCDQHPDCIEGSDEDNCTH
ncbi:hypothetical protein QQF64_029354, partial [Cirrhinus molitorella]